MLVDAIRGKFDFPELKAVALEQYKYWEPESIIIEAKGHGSTLNTRTTSYGYTCYGLCAFKGRDKFSRVNAVAPIFESGSVYYPEGEKFADEVIEECLLSSRRK